MIRLLFILFLFACGERLFPERPRQPVNRPQWKNDLAYLAFNGIARVAIVGALLSWAPASHVLRILPGQAFDLRVLDGRPFVLQVVLLVLVGDLVQWGIHRLLHSVPLLWEVHKIHHSVHYMDILVSHRFHWLEHFIYGILLYVPLSLLGGSNEAMFTALMISTCWSLFTHSNLRVDLGLLGFVLNTPRMHMWHHDVSSEGGVGKNYGAVFSLWDWAFGTAYWPRDRAPGRIGYTGDSEVPEDLSRQLAFPFTRVAPLSEREPPL